MISCSYHHGLYFYSYFPRKTNVVNYQWEMFQNDAKKAGNRPKTNALVANRPGSAAKVNLFNNYTKNAYYQLSNKIRFENS